MGSGEGPDAGGRKSRGRAAVLLRCQGPGGHGSSPSVQPQGQGWVQPAAPVARSQGSGVLVEVLLGSNVGGYSQQRGLGPASHPSSEILWASPTSFRSPTSFSYLAAPSVL